MRVHTVFLLLTLAVCSALAAQEEAVPEEEAHAFQRRLVAALRFPESTTNIEELIPSNDQMWKVAQKVKDSGRGGWFIFGENVFTGKDLKNHFSKDIVSGIKAVREFCFRHSIDVQKDPERLLLTTGVNLELVILRFSDSDLLLISSRCICDGRIFVGKLRICGSIRRHGNTVRLVVSFAPDSTIRKDLFSDGKRVDFFAQVDGDKPSSSDDALTLFLALVGKSMLNVDLTIEQVRKAKSSLEPLPIPKDSKLASDWLDVIKSRGEFKLTQFECRLADEQLRSELRAAKLDEERWIHANLAEPEDAKMLDALIFLVRKAIESGSYEGLIQSYFSSKSRNAWERSEAEVKRLFIEEYFAERREKLVIGLKAIEERKEEWLVIQDEARLSRRLGGLKSHFTVRCKREEGIWKVEELMLVPFSPKP